jgi:hypothetical protein
MVMQRAVRIVAAGMMLGGGAVHLTLWMHGYRGIPYIGTMFLVNAVMSALAAVGLVLSAAKPIALFAVALSLGSLAALVLSRTVGLVGFMDSWTPASVQVIATELGATIAIATAITMRRQPVLQPARSS